MITIMVDIDGVLVDWLGKFRKLYNDKVTNENDFQLLNGDNPTMQYMGMLVDYNVKAPINGLNQGFVKEVLDEIDEIKGEVNTDLVDYLMELDQRDDIRLEVVTARTRHLDHTYALMKELGFKDGHIILGMKHKGDLAHKYDLMIDDSPYIPREFQSKQVMPMWSYNWHLRDKVAIYGSTSEIIEGIEKYLDSRGAVFCEPKRTVKPKEGC